MYRVIKTDGETSLQSQCGGAVKTAAKAMDLKARMRAQQPAGSSSWFSIERVEKTPAVAVGHCRRAWLA